MPFSAASAALATVPAPLNNLLPPVSAEQIADYQRDGYLLLGQLLDQAGVQRLRDEMERVMADQGRSDRPQPVMLRRWGGADDPQTIWQIVNIWQASPAFAELAQMPALAAAVAKLHGARELRLWHDQIQYKPAKNGGTNNWHQDSPYWPVLAPQDAITAWIALDDAGEDNGCMSMVPGSHRWGDQIELLHTIKDFKVLPEACGGERVESRLRPVPAGWVHIHHSLTWHGSHSNYSGRPRRAIALHFFGEDVRFRAAGNHVMKPFIQSADGEPVRGEPFLLVHKS